MNSALSPREIQARLRAGASIPEVAAEAGVDVDRIDGFALPVMAERAHMTRTALGSSVRRRGDGPAHRRLGEIVRERLQARALDADTVEWDAWRQNDLKWRLVGHLDDQAASRVAEFVFDPKGRFSVPDNADARWMIGEHLPGPQPDPDNENTIDFNDELALFRAVSDAPPVGHGNTGRPGDDVPPFDSPGAAHTSELDELYDMLSGVSEDSVRIYLGLEDTEDSAGTAGSADEDTESMAQDELATVLGDDTASSGSDDARPRVDSREDEPETTLADKLSEHPELEHSPGAGESDREDTAAVVAPEAPSALPADDGPDVAGNEVAPTSSDAAPAGAHRTADAADAPSNPSPAAPEQDALVEDVPPAAPKRKPAKKRASIPSWDEIMFGGPSRG